MSATDSLVPQLSCHGNQLQQLLLAMVNTKQQLFTRDLLAVLPALCADQCVAQGAMQGLFGSTLSASPVSCKTEEQRRWVVLDKQHLTNNTEMLQEKLVH